MSDTTVTKHRSTRVKIERGIYKRERAGGKKPLYSVYHSSTFISEEADGTPLTDIKAARARRGELIGYTNRGQKPLLATKTTFAELAETWLAGKRLRPRTLAYYRDALDLVLLPRFGKQKLAAIDADAIAKLIRELEQRGLNAVDPKRPVRGLGDSSIDNYLKPLQGTLALALRRRLIGFNPFATLTKDERPVRAEKAQPHGWTDEEISELLQAAQRLARQPASRQDYSFLLALTVRLGLRLGEVIGLKWGDLDKDEGVLHVRRQWLRSGEYGPTKTPAGVRTIPLPHELRDELIALRLVSSYSQDSDPIFASRNGKPLGHRNVTRRGWEAARDLAGLPKSLTFHQLRHAAASRLIATGLDPVTVASVLGHDDPGITLKVYAHLFNKQDKHDAVRLALAGDGQA
jgi:integrase